MKIGITCYPTFGGSGVLATELGKLLVRNGHEVHFITSAMPYRLQQNYQGGVYFHLVDNMTYPLFENQSTYTLALATKLKDIFIEESLDVLHMHYAMPHALSAFLAAQMLRPRKVPIVTTLHGTDITIVGQDKSLYDITRLGINESTVVTSVSNYLTTQTNSIFKPEKEVKTIYNFVDTDLFKPQEKLPGQKNCFTQGNEIVLLHISNFRPVKRVPDVIEVFYRVQKEVSSLLVLVGEGPSLAQAKTRVQELQISHKVKFLGKQEDIITFLNDADIFLFPSENESFGLAALEAMACEIPVVGYAAGGLPEVLENGIHGYLCELGDVPAMTERTLELALSKELRLKMGKAGRKRAIEQFGSKKIIEQYEAVYAKAIELA